MDVRGILRPVSSASAAPRDRPAVQVALHLFQDFPLFLVIHTVKGFGIVNKAEIDAFLELLLFP